MPNTSVRAAAEGMPDFNRRHLLGGVAALSAMGAAAFTQAAQAGEMPINRLHRLAEDMAHTLDEWSPDRPWSATVWPASSGRGLLMTDRSPDLDPDNGLIELGSELDRLLGEWAPISAKARELSEQRFLQAEAEGVSPFHRRLTEAQNERFWQISRDTGAEAAIEADHEICLRIDTLNRRIRAIPPTTLGGLAVWAKATRFDCLGMDDPDVPLNEMDWDKECLIRLLNEIERLAAVHVA